MSDLIEPWRLIMARFFLCCFRLSRSTRIKALSSLLSFQNFFHGNNKKDCDAVEAKNGRISEMEHEIPWQDRRRLSFIFTTLKLDLYLITVHVRPKQNELFHLHVEHSNWYYKPWTYQHKHIWKQIILHQVLVLAEVQTPKAVLFLVQPQCGILQHWS